jgi:hypothetical protein
LDSQVTDELIAIARDANAYANYVEMIKAPYDQMIRENSRYETLARPVEAVASKYSALGNEFKNYRNQAYLNLGKKAEGRGDKLLVLLYYRDTHRLSVFACQERMATDAECPRLEAEKGMQRLLSISTVEPYAYFKLPEAK